MAIESLSSASQGVSGRGQPLQSLGFSSWKNFVDASFPGLEHRNHAGPEFRAEACSCDLAGTVLTTIQAAASEVIRTRSLAERADAGYVKLLWQLSGGLRLEQDGRECALEAGQAAVCDTGRPYRILLSDRAHFAVLMLPYRALPGWEGISERLCGTRLADDATMRASLAALLALRDAAGGAESVKTVLKAVQWMLATSLHRAADVPGATPEVHARLFKARQYILRHLHDPDLDADDLATALCVSRRSLYMLFKECGLTPTRMIHDIRLQRTMQVLCDAGQRQRKITDIAFDHGFNDYATFSRLFKAQYGMTPSDCRERHQGPNAAVHKGF